MIIFTWKVRIQKKSVFSRSVRRDRLESVIIAREARNRIDNERRWRHYAKQTEKERRRVSPSVREEERRKKNETSSPYFSSLSWNTRKKKTQLYKDVRRPPLRTVLTSRRRPSVCGLTWLCLIFPIDTRSRRFFKGKSHVIVSRKVS